LPELPEVETLKNSLAPSLEGQVITYCYLYNKRLRWPVDSKLKRVVGQKIHDIHRRAKYLVFTLEKGFMIIHLGMSGTLIFKNRNLAKDKHDHVQFTIGKHTLYYNDPRRFGSIHYVENLSTFWLFEKLGCEPLSDIFNGKYLLEKTRKRQTSIKQIIMNSNIVTGVGNIYASESLYDAGIRPSKKGSRLTKMQCHQLALSIKKILKKAIKAGGTTLLNFKDSKGKMGYFIFEHKVYRREGLSCLSCEGKIKKSITSGRSSFYCLSCQS
jgi:formamidopyrimidine-DNA glycosylase